MATIDLEVSVLQVHRVSRWAAAAQFIEVDGEIALGEAGTLGLLRVVAVGAGEARVALAEAVVLNKAIDALCLQPPTIVGGMKAGGPSHRRPAGRCGTAVGWPRPVRR